MRQGYRVISRGNYFTCVIFKFSYFIGRCTISKKNYVGFQVPRALWHSSQKGYMLSNAYFKSAKLSVEKSEAEENLEDVLEVREMIIVIHYSNERWKAFSMIYFLFIDCYMVTYTSYYMK